PAKREVRFRSEPQVRGFVIRAVLQRLREIGQPAAEAKSDVVVKSEVGMPKSEVTAGEALPSAVPVARGPGPGPISSEPPKGGTTNGAAAAATPRPMAAPPVLPTRSDFGFRTSNLPAPPTSISTPQRTAASTSAPAPTPTSPAWRFVGLAHGNYALFETSAGVVLLDRRAAHERVWFERLREQFAAGAVPSQRLLLPVPMELDAIAAALLLDRLKFLNEHGFEVSEFGRNFFRVEAVPAWMEPADAEPFLRDLLGAFREGTIPDRDTNLAREELARIAVAKAVRLPETVSELEVRALMTQLFATRTPLTSPSGRPTYIELNHGELSRRFQK
ncbi:MAG: DNA mismatch repair protein MutL, partial [Verrucomicrobiota bacterium]